MKGPVLRRGEVLDRYRRWRLEGTVMVDNVEARDSRILVIKRRHWSVVFMGFDVFGDRLEKLSPLVIE